MKGANTEEDFEKNGVIWTQKSITITLSGEADYKLTALKLEQPNKSKSKIAKELLEETLL